MAQFHFVEDYERHISSLVENFPIDEAMARAVGGSYEAIGAVERQVMIYAGLKDGMALLDLGCGSGRLAAALGSQMNLDYLGLDIVQQLLDYAATKTPPHFRYELSRALSLPAPDNSFDFFSAFSVFTHLLQSETYLYLKDAYRVLKPGGTAVFTFLELANPEHWPSFEGDADARKANAEKPLNSMLDRGSIECLAQRLGYVDIEFVDGRETRWDGPPMWQAVAILRKPQTKVKAAKPRKAPARRSSKANGGKSG